MGKKKEENKLILLSKIKVSTSGNQNIIISILICLNMTPSIKLLIFNNNNNNWLARSHFHITKFENISKVITTH